MIYLGNLIKITDTKYSIGFIHYMPFDAINGLGKTQEQLEQEGILIESVPQSQVIEGKTSIMYVNPVDKLIFYEYEDIPKSKEDLQQELNAKLLKDSASMQIELNSQKQLNADLLLKIAKLGGGINA